MSCWCVLQESLRFTCKIQWLCRLKSLLVEIILRIKLDFISFHWRRSRVREGRLLWLSYHL